MSDTPQSLKATCPLCASETALKQVHRKLTRRLDVFRCLNRAVEYPVIDVLTRE